MKKKIAIIGTNGIPARYGGFETLAHYLTKELGEKFDFTVYCSKMYSKHERVKSLHKANLIYLPLRANGYQSLFYDLISTIHAFFTADVLLILGPAAGFLVPLNMLFRKNIIVNHGGLDEWERNKLSFIQKKYIFFNHKLAAKHATFNIADNEPLGVSLKKSFGVKAEIIAYGGDHVKLLERNKDIDNEYSFLKLPFDLSISRAQEDNNLHVLLQAYSQNPNRNLVLISNWVISDYGKKLKTEYINKYSNIFIVDAVYNKTALDVIRGNTKLYIHSHSQCGTAPSLVEAMNYNIPIICFDVPTNRLTTNNQSKYFRDSVSLNILINKLSENELENIKENLFKLAKSNYTWGNIACKYSKLFNNI